MDQGTVREYRRGLNGNGGAKRDTAQKAYESLIARGERARLRLNDGEREFIDELIDRSGLINRWIMRLYMAVDVRGLDRWYVHIQRLRRRGVRRLELFSYWPLRVLERLSAIYIGGSLTAREQGTFGLICRMEPYELSRYNALIFGSLAGVLFFTSGNFSHWLGGVSGVFSQTLDWTALLLYSVGVASVAVDLFRAIDSWARKRAHMPFGFFPLIINSTTFFKRLADSVRRRP